MMTCKLLVRGSLSLKYSFRSNKTTSNEATGRWRKTSDKQGVDGWFYETGQFTNNFQPNLNIKLLSRNQMIQKSTGKNCDVASVIKLLSRKTVWKERWKVDGNARTINKDGKWRMKHGNCVEYGLTRASFFPIEQRKYLTDFSDLTFL